MRILFLNQYFPPEPAASGVLFHELGEYLQSLGHTVEFISARQDYNFAKKNRRRMVRELSALSSIFFQGLKARRPDMVISGTSPPCLLVAASFIAARHRAKSAHWLMDMYPELAMVLDEVKPGFISGLIKSLMGWAYRRTGLVVALDSDMAVRLEEYRVTAETIQPWVLKPLMASTTPSSPAATTSPGPEWTWTYSGNLGRAHEWETLLQAQLLLEKRNLPCRLLFQGGGASWPLAQARARELGLLRCDWEPYVPESDSTRSSENQGKVSRKASLEARVLVATQRPETQGLLWPSKLAFAITLPRPILWVGPVDGAIARKLRELPCAGIFAPGQAPQIADWLESIYRAGDISFAPATQDATQQRTLSLKNWGDLLA